MSERSRRRVSRYPVALRVQVQDALLPAVRCEARNVGVGGMFIATDTPLELGGRLTVSLTLPNGRVAMVGARVVHVIDEERSRKLGVVAGAGVQFVGLGPAENAAIKQLIEWVRAHKDEQAEYMERAEWLAAAEAVRSRLSIPPPADPSERAPDEAVRLPQARLPAEVIPRSASAPSAAVAALLRSSRAPGARPPGAASAPTRPPPSTQLRATEHPTRAPGATASRPPVNERPTHAPGAAASRPAPPAAVQPPGDERPTHAPSAAAARPAHPAAEQPPPPGDEHPTRVPGAAASRPAQPAAGMRAGDVRSASEARSARPSAMSSAAQATQRPSAQAAGDARAENAAESHGVAKASVRSASDSDTRASASARPTAAPPARPSHLLSGRGSVRPSSAASESEAYASSARASVRPSAAPAANQAQAGRGSVRPSSMASESEAYASSARASVRPSAAPAANQARGSGRPPSGPPGEEARAPSTRSLRPPRGDAAGSPLGAAGQILAQAEAAYAAGQATEASRHMKLLSAMTFEDPRIQARIDELKHKVQRTAAVDFEKQAAHEEKNQRWSKAAQLWQRVLEGRPKDSYPMQRLALAQLQAGVDLRAVMEIAKRAVDLSPNDAQAHRTLAKVYAAADMKANARRELEAAERCSPSADTSEDASPTGLLKRLLGRDDRD